MLDSDQEPSYSLSKNLLLLPRILKLIEDMVNDSAPLPMQENRTLVLITILLCGRIYIMSSFHVRR